jgi:hypothetical protein
MQLPPETRVERHIYLNSKLEVMLREDPLDKNYHSYLYYVQKNNIAEGTSWEEAKGHVPFLEVVILSDPANNFSFMVSFVSGDELDKGQWRGVRDAVEKHLRDFEQEKLGTRGLLFYPEEKDRLESAKKGEDNKARLEAAEKLKTLYKELLAQIRKSHKEQGFLTKLALDHGIPLKEVKSILNGGTGGNPQPAELAKALIVNTELARGIRVYDTKTLETEVLYRDHISYFHKQKRTTELKRPFISTDKPLSDK